MIDPCRLAESVVLARLLNEVEQEFGGEVVGVVAEEGLLECLSSLRRFCIDLAFIIPDKGPTAKNGADHFCHALRLRADVVAVPTTLDDMLDHFLRGLAYRGEIAKPRIHSRCDEVELIAPMHRILRVDVLAYALATGVLESVDCPGRPDGPDAIGEFVSRLSLEHPELLYRFLYSILKP